MIDIDHECAQRLAGFHRPDHLEVAKKRVEGTSVCKPRQCVGVRTLLSFGESETNPLELI